MKALLPHNEADRLKALQRYGILDTDSEHEFDDITLLASLICGTPIAMISLIDENRQWFKSKVGITESETSSDIAFCAHGILQNDVFIIEDAQLDKRFASNPLVTGNLKIRFYAGSPLITHDGYTLGMLCVNDRVPRRLSEDQKTALQVLSRQVVAQLELRHTISQLKRTEESLRERAKLAALDADVGAALTQSATLAEMLQLCTEAIVRHLDTAFARIWTLNEREKMLELQASAGMYTHLNGPHGRVPVGKFKIGLIAEDRKPHLTDQVVGDPHVGDQEWAKREGMVSFAGYPLLVEDRLVGVVAVFARHVLTEVTITALASIANSIALGIERKRWETALSESNEKFHQLAANITDAFWIRSPDAREVHYVSPAFERIWGRPAESLYANPHQWVDFILPEDRERALVAFAGLVGDAPNLDIEYRIVRPDGEIRWVRVRGFQVRDATNKLIRLTGIVTDITERKRLEAQLLQSQKMETVGKLAGGVAHEFNSIMTAIIGQSELLLNDLMPENPLCTNATEIRKAAERAATLTRQLLAYGRKQILQPEILDLNSVLAGMETTLRHLMGRRADVRLAPAAGLKSVKADAGQVEQVIMNMAMNAAHAMPNGGKLTLETANVTLDQDYVSHVPELKAGEYVMLAITDTGSGMSEEVEARVFEPFFTTKGFGQGAGLGLSTCYGIIKQSGGHISVYSELDRGAVFKIYLPQVEEPQKISIQRIDSPDLPRGTETILLVEDDLALRGMAATLLRRLGYTVLAAANGVEALSLTQPQPDIGHIDLLFTDVVMPHMSGKELAERVRALHLNIRILFTSAYTENAFLHQGVLNKDEAFLQKPFTPSALAHKLREVMDG